MKLKNAASISQGNHVIIVTSSSSKSFIFKMFSVYTKTESRAFSNSSDLKNVFDKLSSRDGLVWTARLTVEIKLCFRDGLVWVARLTVELKLCFRDGLVWTV